MRSQDTVDYPPGTIVFAKLKGYPWWPARVEADQDVPAKVLKQRSRSKNPLFTVFFYGSRDYGFFGPDCIRPFDRATVERDLKAKKFKTKDLEIAVRQALDPSLLEELEEEEEEEEEEEPEDEEEEEVAKKADKAAKKKGADKKTNARKKTAPASEEEEEEDKKRANVSNNKRRSRKLSEKAPSPKDRKKRRKSMSQENDEDHRERMSESPLLARKSEEPEASSANHHDKSRVDDLEAYQQTAEYQQHFKRVYHIRHKLQRLVYDKKPGEIPREEYGRIAQVVKEIEDLDMTYGLLRHTKIGKVVKAACTYNYEGDNEYNIRERCQQLMRNWKALFTDTKVPDHKPATEPEHRTIPPSSNPNPSSTNTEAEDTVMQQA
ncbi:uncharacterized protein BYT42DRAFT_569307 [Radiomyces spectabilis]|uniref:uncharacterized protein n=1 Tax=Radiomyces spectabilis TaxID=64574 RepID=UPI00221FFBF3|nr:uncharacterized protein BYT42DRAFT_569307 [Radiomyces spectabilis]KAI8379588.1 hypothetical protein BYT42DRAFT_569307 [Radiomyces spectabilis]